jgi:pimeloyl-ACP methyl ester carboxylesterase
MASVIEDISFNVTRPSGRVLEGTLTVPKKGFKGPCVLFVHGTLSDRNHNFVPDLCTKISKDVGCATYRYDSRFSACEEEPHHRYSFSGYAHDIDDMKCVIQALSVEGFEVFCLFGHSRGANDVFLLAAEEAIKHDSDDTLVHLNTSKLALIAAAPRFHMPRMLTTLFSEEHISTLDSESHFPWETQRGALVVTREDAAVVLHGILLLYYCCI